MINKIVKKSHNKAFTLIELLVVIAIIALLSSIVLSSLTKARDKAKDVAILQELKQFEILLNLEYNETKSFAPLQQTANGGTYIGNDSGDDAGTCGVNFGASKYAAKAREICNNIIANGSTAVTLGVDPTNYSIDNNYSIMATNNAGTFTCVGNSGVSTSCPDISDPTFSNSCTGCYYNP